MRQISSSMLERIKSAQQTLYGNADPRVEIVIQRNNRYIEEGTELQPNTIRTRNPAGSLDLAMRREDSLKAPDMMYMVWVDADGIAKVSTQPYVATVDEKNNWAYKYSLGPAEDVASEFDGYWVRTSEEAEVCFDDPANWTHITTGEPWFFRVLSNGSLVAQQGEYGSTVTLASSGVTTVSAVRSWKPVPMPEQDSGLIVAYIRSGVAYYRAYAEQENGSMAWESERSIPTAPEPAQNVSVFRTNDFRTGFAVESNGEVWAIFSERNWAGMSIPPETFVTSIKIESFSLLIEEIETSEVLAKRETFELNRVKPLSLFDVYEQGQTIDENEIFPTAGKVIDNKTFEIYFNRDIELWDLEKAKRIISLYIVESILISGSKVTVNTLENIDTDGFQLLVSRSLFIGTIETGRTRLNEERTISVRGDIKPHIATFNLSVISIETDFSNIFEIEQSFINSNVMESFTVSINIDSVSLIITESSTDPV